MQAQFTALMTVAKGESTMVETVFENRFQHLEEMRRMGLHSEIIRDTALYCWWSTFAGQKFFQLTFVPVLP